MAKSLRSKRKRKFRNIKRQRYAAKELIKLKKMLGVPVTEEEAAVPPLHVLEYGFKKSSKEEKECVNNQRSLDFKFTEKGTVIALEPSDDETEEMKEESQGEHKSNEGEMEMDHSEKKVYDRKTMKDKSGNYPAWFTQKDIKKQAKKNRLREKIMKKQVMLKAINEKKNKKLMKRKPRKPKSKETTEENSKETTEENSKETTEEKSKETTEEKSKETTEEKSKGTTEEKSKGTTEEKSKGTTEEKSKGTTEEKSKETTKEREKCNIVEQSSNDENQCVKMEL